jgi:hypothetical protein
MILTLKASEITAHSGYRERGRSRKEMKERLLFNGVHVQRDRTAINKRIKLSFPVLSHPTESPFGRRNVASVVAEKTSHLPLL